MRGSANPIRVLEYITREGRNPYRDWLERQNLVLQARIEARIFRVSQGNLGDVKTVGHGVCELRLPFGPGYRVYFGREGGETVILLIGGAKHTQRKDIMTARSYWLDYLERNNDGT